MATEIEGYIQFRSPVFTVEASQNIMIQITRYLNCFCTKPICNILITWETSEAESARAHREAFVRSLDRWIHRRVIFRALDCRIPITSQVRCQLYYLCTICPHYQKYNTSCVFFHLRLYFILRIQRQERLYIFEFRVVVPNFTSTVRLGQCLALRGRTNLCETCSAHY